MIWRWNGNTESAKVYLASFVISCPAATSLQGPNLDYQDRANFLLTPCKLSSLDNKTQEDRERGGFQAKEVIANKCG